MVRSGDRGVGTREPPAVLGKEQLYFGEWEHIWGKSRISCPQNSWAAWRGIEVAVTADLNVGETSPQAFAFLSQH